MIDHLFEGNKRFLETDFIENKDYYKGLSTGQSPKVLWIGCSDSRVDPERITAARAGEIFVHRNIGNIVPISGWNFATVLEYAIKHLKVKDIVICGHSDCGAIKGLDKETDDAYVPFWLGNAIEAKERVDERLPPASTPEEKVARLDEIAKENVRLQLKHLRNYPLVKKAERDEKIRLHGLYFDLGSGTLSPVT
jgi:carbonic anhydrase